MLRLFDGVADHLVAVEHAASELLALGEADWAHRRLARSSGSPRRRRTGGYFRASYTISETGPSFTTALHLIGEGLADSVIEDAI